MSLTEVLPSIRLLPHVDRLRLVQYLVSELAREEGGEEIDPQTPYAVWTPYSAFDAAATMLNALNQERRAT